MGPKIPENGLPAAGGRPEAAQGREMAAGGPPRGGNGVRRAAGGPEMGANSRLSRLLFEAREIASMFADVVEVRTGRTDDWSRRVVADIDAYRAEQGWSPDGFGGEDG